MPVIPKPTGPISHVRRRAIFDHPKSPVDEETYQEYKVSLCDFAILTCLAYDEKMPQPELTQIFRECLNPMASYERQQPSALEHVKREVCGFSSLWDTTLTSSLIKCRERFPFFDRYADNWAISVLIRDYLYNSVRNHNRRRDRLPADTITQPELNAQEDPGDTQLSPSEIAEVGNTFLMANPQESVPPSSDVFRALINACKEEKAIPEHEVRAAQLYQTRSPQTSAEGPTLQRPLQHSMRYMWSRSVFRCACLIVHHTVRHALACH